MTYLLSEQAFMSWGWRVPFFASAGIAGGAFAPLIALSLLDHYGSLSVAAYVAGALAFVLAAVAVATTWRFAALSR